MRSSQGSRSRTYVFSPLLQVADDGVATTEALHLRKLFVAHILFGQEQATPGYGQIRDPTVLVKKLLDRGQVGPATNISTDYHMLEASGVVCVEPYGNGDRAAEATSLLTEFDDPAARTMRESIRQLILDA